MRTAVNNLVRLSNRRKTAFDVEEELQFHIEMLERKYAQQGMSATDANSAALKQFGNPELIKRECVDIRSRNTLLHRVLKTSFILIALAGVAIHLAAFDYKVDRIGHVLIMIAIAGRLLLYVRGLVPSVFLTNKERSPSILS